MNDRLAVPIEALRPALVGWLPHQRRYARKEHQMTELDVDDTVALSGPSGTTALLAVRLSFVDSPEQRDAVPVSLLTGDRALPHEAQVCVLDDGTLVADTMLAPEGATAVVRAAPEAETDPHGSIGRSRRSRR